MKVAVIGTGYVGLVTGTCFAETGNLVSCIDIDSDKIKKLNSGTITIYEPGLEPLFKRNLNQNRLFFTTDIEEGIKEVEIIFLALPTPSEEDGSADLQYILKVADELGGLLDRYTVIVDKSTVPVGTAAKVSQAIAKKAKAAFDVVSNPEFLREGVAVDDFMKPDRVVIGSDSSQAKVLMQQLYAPFVRQGNPIIFMDVKSAELTKYAANAFLATKITFMNEIANLCSLLGADVDAVRQGIGTDTRIGKRFLFAGTGYGGSCFPKDVQALSESAKKVDYGFDMLKAVIKVNKQQKIKLIDPIKSYLGPLKNKMIAIWGLAFKPYTDDIREAPALVNIKLLLKEGVTLRVYDPEAMNNVQKLMGNQIYYAKNQYDALEDVDALLIMTEWPIFRTPDFSIVASKMKNKAIFDGRNLYELNHMKKLNFTYYSIGRKFIGN